MSGGSTYRESALDSAGYAFSAFVGSFLLLWSLEIAAGAAVGVWLVAFTAFEIRRDKQRWKLCEHGVKGGQAQRLCSECQGLEEARRRRLEIERQARVLLSQEVSRLREVVWKRRLDLLALTPREFEHAVAVLFGALGYSAKQTSYTGDAGKDIIAKRNGERLFIECKRWAADRKVGRPELQKLVGATPKRDAQSVFVTTSSFTETARSYARQRGVRLIDGQQLTAMMAEAYPDASDRLSVKVTCRECGNVVTFALGATGRVQACESGHEVPYDFPDGLVGCAP